MKFKGTWIFSALVIAVVAFAIYDYRKTEKSESEKYKEHYAYRDLKTEDVKSFRVQNANGTFEIEKNDSGWTVKSPLSDKADRQEVESYLTSVFTQNLKPVELEGEVNWSEYGLEKPTHKIELVFHDGKTSVLEFGTRTYDEGYYARKDNSSQLMVGDSSWTNYINKPLNDLRDKNLYDGDSEIQSLSVQHKGKRLYKFVKAEGKWQLENNSDFRVDESAVEDLVNKIRHLEADGIAEDGLEATKQRKYGLLPRPETLIEITPAGDDPKPWKLSVSAAKDGKHYLTTSARNIIYEASSFRLNGLNPELPHFRNKVYPFQFDHLKAHQIRIVKKGSDAEERFAKINNKWEYDVENPHATVNESKLEDFLNSLRALRAKTYLGARPLKSKEIKENRVQILDQMQKEIFLMEWGGNHREQEQDHYIVRTNLADEAFAIAKRELDDLLKESFLNKETPAETEKQTKAE